MIVTKLKQIEEIYDMVKEYPKLLIVGCDGCCQPPRGLHEANTLGKLLKLKNLTENKKMEYKAVSVLRQCDDKILANAIRPLVEDYPAMLSLSCGIGVQMMNRIFPEIITYPAQNTEFNGSKNHESMVFEEMCNQCGDCLLGETGGICPVAGCAKELMNGPCGGQINGKCEVGNYEIDCAWVNIYKRLKSLNRLDLFRKYREKRDYRKMTSPNFISLLELDEDFEEAE